METINKIEQWCIFQEVNEKSTISTSFEVIRIFSYSPEKISVLLYGHIITYYINLQWLIIVPNIGWDIENDIEWLNIKLGVYEWRFNYLCNAIYIPICIVTIPYVTQLKIEQI